MKLTMHTAVVLLALAVTASAQDTTVKSRTRIDADEAQVESMRGCLRQAAAGRYTLIGSVEAAGRSVTTDSIVKIDRDQDDTTVTADTRARGDKGTGADADALSTYALSPGHVNLTPHIGRQVQIAAAAVKPGHKDADVKIDDKVTLDPERGRDSTSRSRTRVEIERGPLGQYTVVSVKQLSGTGAAR
jgi:hypothetical protein